MSEDLLKAVLQLFAIVARERLTDEKRNSIREFLSLHLNRDATTYFFQLFEEYSKIELGVIHDEYDPKTQQFVDEWSKIMAITKQVNQALTTQQKYVMVVKVIELVYSDAEISEHQENLIHYIGQALNISREEIKSLRDFVVGQDAEELSSRNVLIVDEGSDDRPYAGPHLKERNLTGLIAILRLPSQETYFIKYLGISVLTLNSNPLRSRKIEIFPAGSTIRGNKIKPIYYSDIVGKFLVAEEQVHITFSAEHLFYHFKNGRAALQNIIISESGGKLVGIMGASGSGKSTLLNVLNGTEKPTSGRVLINGIDIHESPEEVHGVIGYIPQEDLLVEDLTVFENLFFAARLSGSRTKEEAIELAEKVIQTLGLTEIRNNKVGNPIHREISGGQRKRLNIGLELLREPAILFVDEPTSGLSSRDSENIMDLLKELSLRGKMIFVVIHQPSSDIFKMFDSLLILDVGGFQIYYGNPVEAVIYFRDIINAANKNQGACPECGNINSEQIFNIVETRVVNEYGRLTNVRKISAGQWYQYFKQRIKIPQINHSVEKLPAAAKIPRRLNQYTTFIQRDILSKIANKQYVYINVLQAPVLALFISYMVRYYNVLEGENATYSFLNNQNIPVYFFMSVVVALFIGLILSAEEIYRDQLILKREKFLNLSRGTYLLSKVSIQFAISAFQTFLFLIIGNLVLGIPLTELRYWFILFACACFANMLGLNISAAFNSAVTIYILIPLLIIPQLLLSGIVINFDKFNPDVGSPTEVPVSGDLMASRWAFEAYMVTQFRDNPFEKPFYELDKEIAQTSYKQTYLIPQLRTRLSYCINNLNYRTPAFDQHIDLLRREISYELNIVGNDKLPEIDELSTNRFDSTVYRKTAHFLTVLERYYINKNLEATARRQQLYDSLTNTPEKSREFEQMRLRYMNKAVTEKVENTTTLERVVEYEGRLVQKIYPIYQDEHHPAHSLDYSAQLFQPTKHFAGIYFDTLYFNIGVIWIMTAILFVTLYFDLLRKVVRAIENRRLYRTLRKHF